MEIDYNCKLNDRIMTLKMDLLNRRKALFLFSLIFILSCKTNKNSVSEVAEEKGKEEMAVNEEKQEENLSKEIPEEIKVLHSELSDSTFARIQRTSCFGRCPIYVLTVYKSGFAKYHGQKWTDREGDYTMKFDSKKLTKLAEAAEKMGYFSMENIYDNPQVTDLPATITTLSIKNGFKTVINRYGGSENLRIFENFFDEIFKSDEWVKDVDKQ